MQVTNFLMLVSLLIIGCSESVIYKVSDDKPEIVVYPDQIDFGNLRSGFESGKEEIIIVNAGDEDLYLSSPELFDGSGKFGVDFEEYLVVQPSETYIIEVFYTPETFEQNGGFVRIESNDEETPVIDINIVGLGDAPVMTVEPDEFDYGDISIGCDNEERITIRNDGNLDLTIDSVTQMVTQPVNILMEYGSLPDPPWQLTPGQEIDFLVSYIPTDIGHDESLITVAGNDPQTSEVEIFQYGTGDVEQWYTQTYQQEEIPILDVLWVIDNSGSMNQFQTNLSTNITSFVTAFAASGADYNMAVITTDRYMFGTILTPQTPNVEAELSNLVMTGVMGAGMEKGIEMSVKSLGSPIYAGPGGNFFRQDATLIVIYVSDEQDWSNPDWSNYINFFDNIKPPGKFIPYGVISDVPGGCQYTMSNGNVRTLQPGLGYWDLIDYYGGAWYSICTTDWGVQLQDLAGELTGQRLFEIEEPDPIESTIEVFVNGQATTEWEYDESINSIIFASDHVPEEGQTIDISYAVWGCGDES